MADENKSPQIENPAKITLEELAYMVKQMRHNQRRCERNPTPEKIATRTAWEQKVDGVIAVFNRYANEIILILSRYALRRIGIIFFTLTRK